jgi:hypothetical protein
MPIAADLRGGLRDIGPLQELETPVTFEEIAAPSIEAHPFSLLNPVLAPQIWTEKLLIRK